MLAKLGNVEDIVNIFEFPPEIQPVSSLPNTFQQPEKTYKPSSKLSESQPGEVSSKRAALLLPPDAPKSVVLVKIALLVFLSSLEMIFSLLDKLLNMLYEFISSRPPILMPNNCINR